MIFRNTGIIVCQLLILATLVACNSPASAEKSTCTDSAQQYWKKFRSAVLQGHLDNVADLTQFPFILSSGNVDENRTHNKIERTVFIKQYPHLLISDPGLSLEPSTMWDLINSNEKLSASFCSEDGEQFRVGDWVFEIKSKNWRFVQAYTGEE